MMGIRMLASEEKTIMSHKLYIDNLPDAFTENDLMDLFCSYGNIASVKVQVDQVLGKPRSCGCVAMETPQGSRLAMQALNGKEIGAFTLVVSESRPTERRMGVIL
jgi:RNA recognition motif-containing protein